MARPGHIRSVDPAVPGAPLGAAQAHLLLALTNKNTRVWWQAPERGRDRWLRLHTGARSVRDPARAGLAVVASVADLPELERFHAAPGAAPGHSCTLLVEVPSLFGGPALMAHGSGTCESLRIAIAGLPEGFWAEWLANGRRGADGLDIFFTCGTDLLWLPHTTRVRGVPVRT